MVMMQNFNKLKKIIFLLIFAMFAMCIVSYAQVISYSYGVSYYRTNFGGAIGPDGNSNRQVVGEIGLQARGYSLHVANDLFGDGRDRWRSSAIEFGIGDFRIGKQIYTNAPNQDPNTRDLDLHYQSTRWGRSGIGTYRDSEVYSSPLYMGLRQGSNVFRIGVNHPRVQDVTQNGWHLLIGSPLLYTPHGRYSSRYIYGGYHNPFSLY